jgi:hypothetical protein
MIVSVAEELILTEWATQALSLACYRSTARYQLLGEGCGIMGVASRKGASPIRDKYTVPPLGILVLF